MKIGKAFPSKFLSAGDIEDDDPVVTISEIKREKIGDDSKIVVYFEEMDKGLVLNKTNATSISQVLNSDETNDWIGQKIGLFTTMVEFNGRQTEAIRVKLRPVKEQASRTTKPPARSHQEAQDELDELPI
jgi:hypothetical protein